MITRRTRIQLLVFVILTLVGVTFVGARYARLDRIFLDTDYLVSADFADSGGIFEGAEVTYRGSGIGKVSDLQLGGDGIRVVLQIDDEYDEIPADSLAIVGNKSAVGEQYVELQPQSDGGPFLESGSEIARDNTAIPIPTTELLTNIDGLANSVPRDALRTTVSELGTGFKDTGRDLGQIIDTGNSFVQAADANFQTTVDLIRDSRVVLQGQADKSSAIRSFSRDLRLFSGTLADSDGDLRRVIESGSATATELRTFLEQNQVDLGALIRNLVTTGEVVVKHLDGIEQVLVVYPYVVEGGFSVVSKGPEGRYDAEFGLILTQSPPVCKAGYESTDRREPRETEDRPMNSQARCTEPPSQSSARGAQNAPQNRAPAMVGQNRVATYDLGTGEVDWSGRGASAEREVVYTGGAADSWGASESWKWMLLQPAAAEE